MALALVTTCSSKAMKSRIDGGTGIGARSVAPPERDGLPRVGAGPVGGVGETVEQVDEPGRGGEAE